MNNTPELYVYKASAGSGKTFTLAIEYIKLLIENPSAYRNILAVTFTNKATTEMKERILGQLYGIWTNDTESTPYLNKLMEDTSLSAEQIREGAGKALNLLIHDYSRFRIETIDSFFQSVMRNLARELELGANLTIDLDNGTALSDAVDSLMEKLDRTSPVLYWLLDYIDERIQDDKQWKVSNELKSFGKNIFDEEYIQKGEALRKTLEDKDCIKNYRKTLKALQTEALEQMKGFTEQFFGVLDTNGLTVDALNRKKTGIASYFNKLGRGELDEKVRNATVEKHLASPDAWATKTSPFASQVKELAASELIPLLETAESFRRKNNRIVNSCQLSLNHVNNIRLLNNIDEEVREMNYEKNRFLLSDTNTLLHQIIREGDPSFVFEKIGTNIRHIMIDEFQDTSRMQWDNFKLLLMEGLSQGANSLIVGDVKQSIYRWRSGDWGILNGLKDHIGSFPITEKTLKANRRSAANIVQFNNEIFTEACQVLNKEYREEQVTNTEEEKTDCKELLSAYQDVKQDICQSPGKGSVKVTFVDSKKADKTYEEDTLEQLAHEVKHMIAQGIRLNDMAILVRKNARIPVIADYFDKNTSYRIVSDEAFRLDASLSIRLLIDAIRVLVQPENRIARAQLAETYQNQILHRNIDLNTLLLNQLDQYLPEAFLENQRKLQLMPLFELLEKLSCIFQIQEIPQQDAYLFAFYDAVTEYLDNNSSELTAFLSYWDEKLCSKAIPSGEIEGIRILSIHKSKGLEYHTVFLPFCDWKLENERMSYIWCTPSMPPFNDLDVVPINYGSSMNESIYQHDYHQEKIQLWVDNLNLLYVAFTRPKENLVIWCKKDQKNTVGALLQTSIVNSSCQLQETAETGHDTEEEEAADSVYLLGELVPSSIKGKKVTTNKLLQAPEQLPIQMESLETNIDFKQSNRSADFIRGEEEDRSKYIREGQLLHQIFFSIQTQDDLSDVLSRLRMEGIIESAEHEKSIRKLMERALSEPHAQDWFNGSWELYNECTILYEEEGRLQTRRPDRVMRKGDEVVIVDFKFGKKQKIYADQVREYMELLRQMGYTHIQGYLWYVYKNELEEIR